MEVGAGIGVFFNRFGLNYITDPVIIAAITNEASWATGNYTGSLNNLSPGDIYFDSTTKVRYEFDGTALYRSQHNNIIL